MCCLPRTKLYFELPLLNILNKYTKNQPTPHIPPRVEISSFQCSFWGEKLQQKNRLLPLFSKNGHLGLGRAAPLTRLRRQRSAVSSWEQRNLTDRAERPKNRVQEHVQWCGRWLNFTNTAFVCSPLAGFFEFGGFLIFVVYDFNNEMNFI